MDYEEAISFDNLLKALKRCRRGTIWKSSIAGYWINRLKNTYKLRQEILSGKYRISKYLWFRITEPKEREIYASYIKDRQYQHSIIDNIVYPTLSKNFIKGNCACQKEKGTKFCIDYLLKQLREYARKHHNQGYVLQCDIKKFFPSTNHNVACKMLYEKLDEKTAKACSDVIRSFAEVSIAKILMTKGYEKDKAHNIGHRLSTRILYGGNINRVLKDLPVDIANELKDEISKNDFIGVGLGSQVTQTTQITLLDALDHYITEVLGIKVYVRYMDDFILVHESKEYLKYCRQKIAEFLIPYRLRLNNKTQLFPVNRGMIMLHWHIRVTDTGKVIIRKHRIVLNREKRKLRKQKKLLDKGAITFKEIEHSFQCWQSCIVQQGCYNQIIRMRKFYFDLFGRKAIEWNLKKRRLKKQGIRTFYSTLEASYQKCCVNDMMMPY